MATRVPGLFAAGEAVGGANGANRLSGNAITEALVFGARAGESAALFSRKIQSKPEHTLELEGGSASSFNAAERIESLQATMQQDVGPFRNEAGLKRALDHIRTLRHELVEFRPPPGRPFDTAMLDWLDLDTMTRVGEVVARAALARTESRGAHQREDFPAMDPRWERSQVV
jgi:succinate dehydrogenase / fumarate reductase flavoprotein subunit/fumarate reductase (CoM/CoB) subunit A